MTTLYGDLETYCEVPIRNGTYAYAEAAEVMLFAYAIDDGEIRLWDLAESSVMPADLAQAWNDRAVEVVFHNSMFDRTVLNESPSWDWGVPELHRWRDTMVQALAHSLPGALGKLCAVMKVPPALWKHEGKHLIQLFCKPRPKNAKIRRATRHTHPKEWAEFCEYAKYDIAAMRYLRKTLPRWNYQGSELELWHLDQRINDRGFHVDLDLVDGAVAAVALEQKRLAGRVQEMTGGEVESATQRDKLLAYILKEHGVELPDMTADTIERRLQDPDLPIELKNLLGARLEASTASVAKYKALRRAVSQDGRLRGTLQFNGASRTGRWAGRVFQPQNLPRPSMKPHEIETAIDEMKIGVADILQASVMASASNAIRGVITAPQGRKLPIADLSNIEGRFAAWLAGESWKLRAFKDFDEGTGHDLYAVAYAKSFRCSPEEVMHDKKHGTGMKRQIGKVQELMLQYEGGVGAFVTGAMTYRIDLDAMATAAWDAIPDDVLEAATGFYQWADENGNTFGLPEKIFIVCDSLKRLWRAAHPAISSYWGELRDAVRKAIESPGNAVECRKVSMHYANNWLRIKLPSGRYLCYPSPKVGGKGEISYMGANPYTRKWERVKTYGGKLLENITQAGSRDVLTANMPAIEEFGYDIVLSVHDELITESPDDPRFSAERLSMLMSTNPSWAAGLPLAAAGFECYRYRKD